MLCALWRAVRSYSFIDSGDIESLRIRSRPSPVSGDGSRRYDARDDNAESIYFARGVTDHHRSIGETSTWLGTTCRSYDNGCPSSCAFRV